MDIVIGILILLFGSSLMYYAGGRLSVGPSASLLAALIVTASTLYFATQIHGRLLLVRWIPFSNVIVLGNWLPLFAGAMAGIVRSHAGIPVWRRVTLALTILVAGWLSVFWNVVPQEFEATGQFRDCVCIQSTSATCSACAAVTLLDRYGIRSSEREMAHACLTSGRGTNLLGIYRGLRRMTMETEVEVEAVELPASQLTREMCPMIVAIAQTPTSNFLTDGAESGIGSILRQVLGRTDHCVVLMDLTENHVVFGDPSNLVFNPVTRPRAEFDRLCRGQGFRLVRR